MESLIGQALGRYLVEGRLGRGGMAEVFHARDTRLDRHVAVKVILPEYATERQFLDRFLREARVIAGLEHPHVLPIYDFGEEDGIPFLVMPWIRGGSLAERLDGRPKALPLVAKWISHLASALDTAHAHGVLHRDIKPGNVLVGPEDRLFLADFGIAHLADATTRLTRTGVVVGTPVYMAPEVVAGEKAESASDLYSLAVMAYEFLAGRPPFEGENMLSVLHQHTTQPVPPITTQFDHLPPQVDRVLSQGLAKQPTERPTNCHAFATALVHCLPTAEQSMDVAAAAVSGELPTVAMEPQGTDIGLQETLPAQPLPDVGTQAPFPSPAPTPPDSGSYGQARLLGLASLIGAVVAVSGMIILQLLGTGDGQPPKAGTKEAIEAPSETLAPAPEEPLSEEMPSSASTPSSTPQSSSLAKPPSRPSDPVVTPPASSPPPTVNETSDLPTSTASEPQPFDRRLRSLFQGPRGEAFRSLRQRPTAADFERINGLVQNTPQGTSNAYIQTLLRYTEGGLAYLQGQKVEAEKALVEVVADDSFLRAWGPGPLLFLDGSLTRGAPLEDWQLALGYGDPQNTAGPALQTLLTHSTSPQLRVGRALVHRLDNEPRGVLEMALPVAEGLHGEMPAESQAFLAEILAEAFAQLGQGEKAITWYRRAIQVGGAHEGILSLRAARLAHQLHREDAYGEFLRHGCDKRYPPACAALRGAQNQRPRGQRRTGRNGKYPNR